MLKKTVFILIILIAGAALFSAGWHLGRIETPDAASYTAPADDVSESADGAETTSPGPEDSGFGVSIRQFVSRDDAQSLQEDLSSLDTTSVVVEVRDEASTSLFVVVAGPFDTRQEADEKRTRLMSVFRSRSAMSIIRYPAVPESD